MFCMIFALPSTISNVVVFVPDQLHNLFVGMQGQFDETVGVSPFVIVPGDDLVEVVVEANSGSGVNNGTTLVVNKVLTDDWKFCVSKDSLQGTFRSLFESSIHFFGGGTLLKTNSQVHHGNIRGGDADG